MTPLLVLALFVAATADPGQQAGTVVATTGESRHEREILIRRAGPTRLPVDAALLAGASPFDVVGDVPPSGRGTRTVARGGLRDLRIYDREGREIPYLLVEPPAAGPAWVTAHPIAIAESAKTSGFEVDLGRRMAIDLLSIEDLPGPFLKRVGLQASGDRERWAVLSREATVFDLPDQRLSRREIGFPPGEYRYVRLVWDDSSSARMPLPEHVWLRAVNASGPPPDMLRIPLAMDRRPSEPRRSRFRLRLPAVHLPVVALEFTIAGADLNREAAVHEVRFTGQGVEPHVLGRGQLVRTSAGGLSASALRIPIAPPTQALVELVVEDGDNAPLDLRSVSAVCAELPWIYFEAPSVHPLVARYGRPDAVPPRYDLEARRSTVLDVSAAPAVWGPPRDLAGVAIAPARAPVEPMSGAVIDAARFRYVRTIPGGPAQLVALRVDAALLAHSQGPAGRFRDVRILDGADRQVPYLIERLDEPLFVSLARPERVTGAGEALQGRGAPQGTSVFRVRLPFDGLPGATLVLATPARVFERTVHVAVDEPPADVRSQWRRTTVAAGAWRHFDRLSPAPSLALALPPMRWSEALVLIDDGDNSPLPLVSADLLLPAYRLRFYRPVPGQLRVVYGRPDLEAPKYDLRLLSTAVLSETAEESTPDEEHEQPGGRPPAPLAIPPWIYYSVLAVAVVVMACIIRRLLRQGGRSDPGRSG